MGVESIVLGDTEFNADFLLLRCVECQPQTRWRTEIVRKCWIKGLRCHLLMVFQSDANKRSDGLHTFPLTWSDDVFEFYATFHAGFAQTQSDVGHCCLAGQPNSRDALQLYFNHSKFPQCRKICFYATRTTYKTKYITVVYVLFWLSR